MAALSQPAVTRVRVDDVLPPNIAAVGPGITGCLAWPAIDYHGLSYACRDLTQPATLILWPLMSSLGAEEEQLFFSTTLNGDHQKASCRCGGGGACMPQSLMRCSSSMAAARI